MKTTVALIALFGLVAWGTQSRVAEPPQKAPPVVFPAPPPTPLLLPAETAEPPLADTLPLTLVSYAPTSPRPGADDAALVKNLVEILNKTESKDTFAVTAAALVFLKDSRQALPAVIRNGERLGMFEGMVRRLSNGNEPSPFDLGTAMVLLGLLKPQKETLGNLKGLAELIQGSPNGPGVGPVCNIPPALSPGIPTQAAPPLPQPVMMPANLIPPAAVMPPPAMPRTR